jgi:hypothetical protein
MPGNRVFLGRRLVDSSRGNTHASVVETLTG